MQAASPVPGLVSRMAETDPQMIDNAQGLGEFICRFSPADCGWLYEKALTAGQIIFADIILSGDNALVIGMAASMVAASHRRFAIVFGLAMAAILRIIFALIAAHLLKVPGILFVGGLLLAWVCWRFYKDLREFNRSSKVDAEQEMQPAVAGLSPGRQLRKALVTITAADVSMSLDNVIAVAAIAREDTVMLVFGLGLAILLMAFCATIIMKIMKRYPALSWAGLLFLIYLTLRLLYEGGHDVVAILSQAW